MSFDEIITLILFTFAACTGLYLTVIALFGLARPGTREDGREVMLEVTGERTRNLDKRPGTLV